MNEPTMDDLTQRLCSLESENRRFKRLGVIAIVVIASGMMTGQATPNRLAKVIEAEKVVLRDAVGNVRATIGTTTAGTSSLDTGRKGRESNA